MLTFYNLIKDHFYILILFCMGVALVFPDTFSFMYPYLEYYLMVMLFLAFLKTDFGIFSRLLKNPRFPIVYSVFNLIIIPVFFWYAFSFLPVDYRLAVVLIVTVPQGVATPSLIDLIGGSIEKAITCLIVSYLIAPFTIVGVFKFLANVTIELSYLDMFLVLVKMILSPLLIAWIIKSGVSENKIMKLEKFYTMLTISMMMCLTLSTFSHESKRFLTGGFQLLKPLSVVFTVFFILFAAGFLFAKLYRCQENITPIIMTVFTNNTLAIVLASRFFPDRVLFIALLTMIPWMAFLFPVKVYNLKTAVLPESAPADQRCKSQ